MSEASRLGVPPSVADTAVEETAVGARDAVAGRGRVLSLHRNAAAIAVNVFASAGFGYVSWLLAARLVDAADLGIASATISAGLICSNLALLGLGASTITFLPSRATRPNELLNSFYTLASAAALVLSAFFVILAGAFFGELSVVASDAALAASFGGFAVTSTVILLLDATSVAVRRADFAVVRGIVAGVLKLVLLAALLATLTGRSTVWILLAWSVSSGAAVALGYSQLRSIFPGYRYRPTIEWLMLRTAIRNGLPNHALDVGLLAPALLTPIVVLETISPEAGAYWYAIWMIALAVRIVPTSTAQSAFAEIANGATSVPAGVRRCLRASLVGTLPLLLLLVLAAPWVLGLMGSDYADAGTSSLRIVAVSVLPQIVIEAYVMARRVTLRLAEAIATVVASSLLSLTAVTVAGLASGLLGVACAWLAVQVVVAAWAALRLLPLLRDAAP